MEPRTARAKVKGKSLLKDNYHTTLIRLGEKAQDVPYVVAMYTPVIAMYTPVIARVCVHVFTSPTQSGPCYLCYFLIPCLLIISSVI